MVNICHMVLQLKWMLMTQQYLKIFLLTPERVLMSYAVGILRHTPTSLRVWLPSRFSLRVWPSHESLLKTSMVCWRSRFEILKKTKQQTICVGTPQRTIHTPHFITFERNWPLVSACSMVKVQGSKQGQNLKCHQKKGTHMLSHNEPNFIQK